MSHFVFSTFPLNKGVNQHKGTLSHENEFFECSLLASRILGVECSATAYGEHDGKGNTVIYYQITPDAHEALTIQEEDNYEAFNYYFFDNYGREKDRCNFDTPYEAFYNIVKAWSIWNSLLDEKVKQEYLNKISLA